MGMLMMSIFYKLVDKKPVPVNAEMGSREWLEAVLVIENGQNRVFQDFVDDGAEEIHVSTVFLGIDHGFGRGDEPILFETMVFGGKLDGDQARVATWDEAEKKHAEMLARVLQASPGAKVRET